MKMTEIPRASLGVPQATEEVREFGLRVKTMIGYDVLADIEKNILEHVGPLASTLSRLEIEPLDYAAVKKYQLELKQEKEREGLKENLSGAVNSTHFWMPFFSWNDIPIEKYKKPIPEFVLNKAVQIAEALTGVTFFIEELTETKDPFLLVRFKGEEYYIEVWDEPKFEGRITK